MNKTTIKTGHLDMNGPSRSTNEEGDLWPDERGDATLYTLGVLADAGQAERARAILGEDTPWTCLSDIAELPTYRLITVEFLSTFRYRAHQSAVRDQEEEEVPPDIEFSLCGQHMEMSIEQFVVHLASVFGLVTAFVATASVEKTFSSMKHVKTELRKRMIDTRMVAAFVMLKKSYSKAKM
ncbi:hypothetical protein R6Q57_016158 [Mikania cordata]